MHMVDLGRTGLRVSRLGFGGSEFHRHPEQNTADLVGRVLGTALDEGINFLDTAECYSRNEQLIGETVSGRRDEYFLATKCGHSEGLDGEDWAPETIAASVDRSLRRLRTDHVDLLQLHSCSIEDLERGDVIEAVERARCQGKTRFIGYSGDNEDAMWAIRSGYFDTLQISFSIADQQPRSKGILAAAEGRGMGIIAKRPVANNVWRRKDAPLAYGSEYWRRTRLMEAMGDVHGEPDDPFLTAYGFVLAHPEVDTIIVGTHNSDHVRENVRALTEILPIPEETVRELQRRFDHLNDGWPGLT